VEVGRHRIGLCLFEEGPHLGAGQREHLVALLLRERRRESRIPPDHLPLHRLAERLPQHAVSPANRPTAEPAGQHGVVDALHVARAKVDQPPASDLRPHVRREEVGVVAVGAAGEGGRLRREPSIEIARYGLAGRGGQGAAIALGELLGERLLRVPPRALHRFVEVLALPVGIGPYVERDLPARAVLLNRSTLSPPSSCCLRRALRLLLHLSPSSIP
jgi:hypothetical protein